VETLQDWQVLLDEAIEAVDRERAGKPLPPVDEIIREMRDERDAELMGGGNVTQDSNLEIQEP